MPFISFATSLWRNRLARSTVNRKVGGSSPPRDGLFFLAGFLLINSVKKERIKTWARRDSNTQPSDLESDALPLRHRPHIYQKIPTTLGIPRRSPIQVLTRLDAAWLRWSDENRYIQHGMVVGEIILKVALFKFENPKWRHRCFPTMLSRVEFDSALAQCGIIFRNRSHLLGLEQTDNGSRRSSISRSIKYSFDDVIIYGRACATTLGNGLWV